MRRLRNLQDELGIAMVTVLFVGAALTAVSSTAAYVTIQDLRAGTADNKSAAALSYAEAGVDRLLQDLRIKDDWGQIRMAGCDASHPAISLSGTIGNGSFNASLLAYDPVTNSLAPAAAACSLATHPAGPPRKATYFAIKSTGQSPSAQRVVRQALKIRTGGLPAGVYAGSASINGNPSFDGASLITPGDVTGRDKLAFSGTDPINTIGDFWPTASSSISSLQAPAGVHAAGSVYIKSAQEHTISQPLNCSASNKDTPGQSEWDQSGTGGPIGAPKCSTWAGSPAGPPPTSFLGLSDIQTLFPQPALSDDDYLAFKEQAKQAGLYCNGSTCTKAGGISYSQPGTIDDADVTGLPNEFVAYFDYPAGSSGDLKWHATVNGCNPAAPGNTQSAILIIRNHSLVMQSNFWFNGAVFVPEGNIDSANGTPTINGTVITKDFNVNGNFQFSMNQCWADNLPGVFWKLTTTRWSEVDR